METIVGFDIKVGRCSQLNVYMNMYEYQSQGHSLTFVEDHSVSTFSNSFSLEPLGELKPNFVWSLLGMGKQKLVQMV